jgi:hypothetical protein
LLVTQRDAVPETDARTFEIRVPPAGAEFRHDAIHSTIRVTAANGSGIADRV